MFVSKAATYFKLNTHILSIQLLLQLQAMAMAMQAQAIKNVIFNAILIADCINENEETVFSSD